MVSTRLADDAIPQFHVHANSDVDMKECELHVEVEGDKKCPDCGDTFRRKYALLQKAFKREKDAIIADFNIKLRQRDEVVANVNKQMEELSQNSIPIGKDCSQNAVTLARMILKPRLKKYTKEEKLLCLNIHYKSPSTMRFMRDSMQIFLPSDSSFARWNPIKRLNPGLNPILLRALKAKADKMSEDEKVAVLMYDEMAIKVDPQYNSVNDCIDGFVDLGDNRRTSELATKALFFMVKGELSSWKYLLAFYFVGKSMTGSTLKGIIMEVVTALEDECGIIVSTLISDQAGQNIAAFNLMHNDNSNVYFKFRGRKIYTLFDPPHLFKGLRNTMLAADIDTPEGKATWNVYKETVDLDNRSLTTRMLPRITDEHINLTHFNKMRVRTMTQVFSNSMAVAIRTCRLNNKFEIPENKVNAFATEIFTSMINHG